MYRKWKTIQETEYRNFRSWYIVTNETENMIKYYETDTETEQVLLETAETKGETDLGTLEIEFGTLETGYNTFKKLYLVP